MTTAGAGTERRRLTGSQLARQPDAVLVVRARDGSEAAFAEIVRRYERPLQAYCSRVLDAALAKDAVQQTFLRALATLRRRDATCDLVLRPWLYRVAHRCALDIRRGTRVTLVELDEALDDVAQPHQLVELHEQLDDVVAAVRKLPATQRRALVARELEGRSYNEISDELDQSDAGVRQLIFRARTALRDGLGAILPVPELRRWLVDAAGQLTAALGAHGAPLARGAAIVLSASCLMLGIACTGPGTRRGEPGAQHVLPTVADTAVAPAARVTLVALLVPVRTADETTRAGRASPKKLAPALPAGPTTTRAPSAVGSPSTPPSAAPGAVTTGSDAAPVASAAQAPDPTPQSVPAGDASPPPANATGSPSTDPASAPATAPSATPSSPTSPPAPPSRGPHPGGPPAGHGPQAPTESNAGGESSAAPGHSGTAHGGSGAGAGNPGLHRGQVADDVAAVDEQARLAGRGVRS